MKKSILFILVIIFLFVNLSIPIYAETNFIWPVPEYTRISSEYGERFHPLTGTWKMHTGIDIAAAEGKQIIASKSGTIAIKGWDPDGYGNYLVINHGNGWYSLYAHCKELYAEQGDSVNQGQKIAIIGSTGSSTGPHLHFEIRKNGSNFWAAEHVDPLNYVGPDDGFIPNSIYKTDVFAAFSDGWKVSYGGTSNWVKLSNSTVPLSNLKFGDFNGDAKTDVFAAFSDGWKVSYGGTSNWVKLASSTVTNVKSLLLLCFLI